MKYKYIAESSKECKDLEERIKKLEEHSIFEVNNPNGTLIITNKTLLGKTKIQFSFFITNCRC